MLHSIHLKLRLGTTDQRTVMITCKKENIGAEHETLNAGTKKRRSEKQDFLRPQAHTQVRPADQSESITRQPYTVLV